MINDIYSITKFTISEIGGSEPSFYYLDYPEGVDNYKLFDSDFEYCSDEEGFSCSLLMITEGLIGSYENLDKGVEEIVARNNNPVKNLEEIMQKAKIKVVEKLFSSFTLSQMNIEVEE